MGYEKPVTIGPKTKLSVNFGWQPRSVQVYNPLAYPITFDQSQLVIPPGAAGAVYPWTVGGVVTVHTDTIPTGAPPAALFNPTGSEAVLTFFEDALAPSPGLDLSVPLVQTYPLQSQISPGSLNAQTLIAGVSGETIQIVGYQIDLQEDIATISSTGGLVMASNGSVGVDVLLMGNNCDNQWNLDFQKPLPLEVGAGLVLTNRDTIVHHLLGVIRYRQY